MSLDLAETFGTTQPIIGMVHLPALPGAPGYDEQGGRAAVRERALADARTLAAGGVDGLVVENYGDAPFYPEEVPRHVVADMTCITDRVAAAVDLPVGVNVLRNDATAALSIAAAVDAAFVRINVHTGARVTDQGVIEGRAHETLRLRDRLDTEVAILADVAVKHSVSLGEPDLPTTVADAIERGNVDGLVVSGPATGESTDTDDLRRVTDRRDDIGAAVPVFVGSGVTAENVADLLSVADGTIVGTALKEDGVTTEPVERARVERLVTARADG